MDGRISPNSKRGSRDPWTAESVQFFKAETGIHGRFFKAEAEIHGPVQFFEGECRDPWTAESVRIKKGEAGIHGR